MNDNGIYVQNFKIASNANEAEEILQSFRKNSIYHFIIYLSLTGLCTDPVPTWRFNVKNCFKKKPLCWKLL